MPNFRELTTDEKSIVSARLADLRRTFAVWSDDYDDDYGDDYNLIAYAYYEGCDQPVLAAAAPYAVGRSLVEKNGFTWVMVQSGSSWHHGVIHPMLPEPIDLLDLESGKWCRPEPDDEPPQPGEATMDSLDVLILAVEWKRLKGREAPMPKGSFFEIEQQVNRARIFWGH